MDSRPTSQGTSHFAFSESRRCSVCQGFTVIKYETERSVPLLVRDVALAHVLAQESEHVGGERFIVSNGPFCIQDICALRIHYLQQCCHLTHARPLTLDRVR